MENREFHGLKCYNDLNVYTKNELESFIEIMNLKKSNIITGFINRHLSMDLTDLNVS